LIHALQSEFNDTPVEQINQNLNLNDKIPNNFDEQVNSIQVKSFNSIDECSINTPCSKKQQADTLKISESTSTSLPKTHDNIKQITNKSSDIDNEELAKLQNQIKGLLSELEATGLENLSTTSSIKHTIRIEPGVKPMKQRIRPVPPKKMQEFSAIIKSMVQNGIIRPCKFSPWSSPVRLVGKKDGTIRVTQDYRKLNSVTIKDAYPLPNISQIISTLGQARFFTSLDFAHGYYQIELEESSKQFTAFACELGQFEYNRLAMGLTNECETFQKLMNEVLDGLIGHICFVYLDDILIFSSTMQEHLEHVKLVVQRLRNHNLKVKPKKCEIAKTRIEYLSHIIENGTVRPNPKKIQAILDFKQPTSIRQLQAFNGMVSYYRKYIEQLTKIMTPLIQATTEKKLEWTSELQTAFNNCKSVFLSEKVLALPNFDLPFSVAADACEYGVGGVLSQQDPNDSTQVQLKIFRIKKLNVQIVQSHFSVSN